MGEEGRPPANGAEGLALRILGPVRAVRAGRDVPLGGPKQRAVLALLLIDAGRVVPAETLIEALWGDDAPAAAVKTLRAYLSRLRTELGPQAPLVGQGGGYAIKVGPGQVDAVRFERLVAAGNDALRVGDAAVARSRFEEALALWRGRALADVTDVEPLAREAARLEELRLVAMEGRAEADIELGLHAEVTGALERLVAEHPVRERMWRLLVLALYRGERQADALAAYRRARKVLADELGLEPGEELRRLEQAVLRQEVPAAAPRVRRHNLPASLTSFLGRDGELAALRDLLAAQRLVTLTGAGGAGKTRLAVEAAAGMADRFPDGAWLADLAAITDPGLVSSLVMETLGVRQTGDVPVIEALTYRLQQADLLLLLDNCEHLIDACAALAGALVRGCPGLRVLATSREPLGVPGEVIFQLQPLAVPPDSVDEAALADEPALRLFLDRRSAARGGSAAAAQAVSAAAVAGICRELDGLPLAIELAAARAGVLSVEEIRAHLTDKFRFLAYRRPVRDRRHQALAAAIGWSYELLAEGERAVFRTLSVFAGSFGLPEAAAVCCDGDELAALDMLEQLSAKSLVVVADPDGSRTRYRLLETIRQYAADALAKAGEDESARLLHAETFLGLAERERDVAVLARERDNFRAALGWSLERRHPAGPRLACALGGFWLARGLFDEGKEWLGRAVAARQGDNALRAHLLRLLGTVLYAAGDLDRAAPVLGEGLQIADAAGLPVVGARIQAQLAVVRCEQGGGAEGALRDCESAAALLESAQDLEGLAEAWLSIGTVHLYRGDAAVATAELDRASGYARRSGNRRAELQSSFMMVQTLQVLPVPADVAVDRAERLLDAARGDPWAEAVVLQPLSLLYAYLGRLADARAALARSRAVQAECGARFDWAMSGIRAGQIEMVAGNPAAAELEYRVACDALRAMGERSLLSSGLAWLAEAVYAQGRFGEVEPITEEAEEAAPHDDVDAQARWRAARAKALAQRGEFAAASALAEQASALIAPTSYLSLIAEVLIAKSEIARLAGEAEVAAGYLREALRIYQDSHSAPLAERTEAALASLSASPGSISR